MVHVAIVKIIPKQVQMERHVSSNLVVTNRESKKMDLVKTVSHILNHKIMERHAVQTNVF